ncbi:MAG: hypothetical protein EHM35_00360 [Planctomycetaceae bacterium]|nr:MAG: hypothetical protein EHM35_00360 [Planctomycetaceae bacterium]
MNVTATHIQEAYRAKADTLVSHHIAAEQAIAARAALEIAKLAGLAGGTIDGKNADLREAKAREVLAEDYARLEAAEAGERRTHIDLDLACIQVEEVRALLRLMELDNRVEITCGAPGVSVKAL